MMVKRQDAAPAPLFLEQSLRFMRSMRRNNRREWFEPRKPEFERLLKLPMLALIERVNHAMQEFAPWHVRPAQKIIMRIYRDTRFSPDKRPYKGHMSAWWARQGMEKTTGAGFYVQVSPDEVIVAAGAYMPERDQLRAIRNHLLEHHAAIRDLLQDRKLRRVMNIMNGLPLTRAPKGFPKEHPGMDLLLCRQWGVESTLEPEAALDKDFAGEVIRRFRLATPLIDALNAPLRAHVESNRRPLFGLAPTPPTGKNR